MSTPNVGTLLGTTEFTSSAFAVLQLFVYSIIDSSSSSASPVRDPAFPSAVFLSDGRLMIGSSRGVVLLEEVPVPTNERWMSARTVATAEPFPATTSRLCGHSICLSARDEILAVSLEENSHNLVARQLFIE